MTLVRCEQVPHQTYLNTTSVTEGFRFTHIDGMYFRINLSSGVVWQRMYETCTYSDGSVERRLIWVTDVDPDPAVLIPGAVDEATERVYAPVPVLSPVTRGVVNLGMWLAVADPGPVTARASASATTWAEATASLRATVFDMGNGDVVTCSGAGDRIPESAVDSYEPSPICGYTYTDTNGGAPYHVTITSTWSVVTTTSSGVVAAQNDIVLTSAFDYPVVEVQTVGVSG